MTAKKKEAPEATQANSNVPYGPMEKDNTALKVVLFVALGFIVFICLIILCTGNLISSTIGLIRGFEAPDAGFSISVDGEEVHVGLGDSSIDVNKKGGDNMYFVSFEEGTVESLDKVNSFRLYGYLAQNADDLNKVLIEDQCAENIALKKGEASEIRVTVCNKTAENINANEASVTGVEFSSEGIAVRGDLKIGSTVSDVKGVFGEPSEIKTTDEGGVMFYSLNDGSYSFTLKDGKVSSIKWIAE